MQSCRTTVVIITRDRAERLREALDQLSALPERPPIDHATGLKPSRTCVVIATRNRARELSVTLRNLRDLPDRPHVVVVDNGSSEEIVEAWAAAHPWVELIELSTNAGCAARTVGAESSRQPFVAFSDDDSWWAPGSLDEAEALFDAYPRLGGIAATVLVGPSERVDPLMEVMRNGLPPVRDLPGIPVLGFLACGFIVRREALLSVGGFEPRFGIGGEEALLAMDLSAAGWGVCWIEQIVAHHHPATTRDREARRLAEIRNGLWTTWLRRPMPVVVRACSQVLMEIHDPMARRAAAQAIRGLPWVLRNRRRLPTTTERSLQSLDRHRV